MEFVKKSLGTWVTAAIVLVVGILCIVAGAQYNAAGAGDWNAISNASSTSDAISLTLGISFIVVGSLGILLALLSAVFAKKGFSAAAGTAGTSLAIGIWLVVTKSAMTMIGLVISFVPYLLIVLGSIIVIDTTFTLVNAFMAKSVKTALVALIAGYVIGAVAIVLGSLCVAGVIENGVQLIIFGIIVILYALYMVAATFVKVPTILVVETKTEVNA